MSDRHHGGVPDGVSACPRSSNSSRAAGFSPRERLSDPDMISGRDSGSRSRGGIGTARYLKLLRRSTFMPACTRLARRKYIPFSTSECPALAGRRACGRGVSRRDRPSLRSRSKHQLIIAFVVLSMAETQVAGQWRASERDVKPCKSRRRSQPLSHAAAEKGLAPGVRPAPP